MTFPFFPAGLVSLSCGRTLSGIDGGSTDLLKLLATADTFIQSNAYSAGGGNCTVEEYYCRPLSLDFHPIYDHFECVNDGDLTLGSSPSSRLILFFEGMAPRDVCVSLSLSLGGKP